MHEYRRLIGFWKKLTFAATLALASWSAPAIAAPAETFTMVEHNVTLPPQFFPDDICGERASFETVTYKTSLFRITETANDGLHVVDVETGTIQVDYVDPTIADTVFRITNAFHFNATPGEAVTITETLRQSDGELTVRYKFHVTVIDGEPKVLREVTSVRGCP